MLPAVPSFDSLSRPGVIFGVVSTVVAVSAGVYYGYEYYQNLNALSGRSGRLHRSNAIRRRRGHRRSRRSASTSSSSSASPSTSHSPETGNAAVANNNAGPQTLEDGPTLEDGFSGEWWDDASGFPVPHRAGHNIVNLLFRVSEDNARRNACVHRGCRCNGCGAVPIRGLRYHCANCPDFDLCETCESQGLHYKTHVFYKIRIPAKTAGTRHMQPVWYTGDPDNTRRTLSRSLIAKLSRQTGLERPDLEAHWEQWTFMANTEWRDDPDELCIAMDRKTFERCLVTPGGQSRGGPNLIHDRMFSFYDTNHDGLIGFTEYLNGISLAHKKDKLQRIFRIYDIDGDGFVSRRDFLRLFRANYVLSQQMISLYLDIVNDQRLGSGEVRQLVTGRQPLSSTFGRDERVPSSDRFGDLEGKIRITRDDFLVVDSDGDEATALRTDRPDTASRQEVLMRLFSRKERSYDMWDYNSSVSPLDNYIDALLTPPTTTEELSNLLAGNHRTWVDDPFDPLAANGSFMEDDTSASDGENDGDGVQDGHNSDDMDVNAPNTQHETAEDDDDDEETQTRVLDFTVEGPDGSQYQIRAVPHAMAGESREDKQKRIRIARKQLHERWKRRQFYLDEEEGAEAPQGWDAKEDVFNSVGNGSIERGASASHQRPDILARSRSNSRVRFAQDMTDDSDTRSNHSASSRSIPERWGGMDIPVAEKDAGKEILYQVTQEAYNELLDVLFKKKEDLATQAAATRQKRHKYKHLLDTIDLEQESGKGYEVVSDEDDDDDDDDEDDDDDDENEYTSEEEGNQQEEEIGLANGGQQSNLANTTDSALGGAPVEEQVQFDPTMPQFRPNSIPAATTASVPNQPSIPTAVPISTSSRQNASRGEKYQERSATSISRKTLVEWKRLDVAEAEAAARGGWGKLTFAEFEVIYKLQQMHGNKLDYIGAWIEHCIL